MATFRARIARSPADRPQGIAGARPVSGWGFFGVSVTSFGGPLALAAPWRLRPVIVAIGVAMVAMGPVTLINPDAIYNDLLTPSLVALWLSQLIVFAVYPRYAARQGHRVIPAWILAAASTALALYGLWPTIQHAPT